MDKLQRYGNLKARLWFCIKDQELSEWPLAYQSPHCGICHKPLVELIKADEAEALDKRNKELEAVIKELEEFVKHVSFDSCQCTLKYGLKYPSEHLRDCIVGKAQDYFKGK